jgi:hypothetical protein
MTELLVAMGVLALHVPAPPAKVVRAKTPPVGVASTDRPHEARPAAVRDPAPAVPPAPPKRTHEQVVREAWPLPNAKAIETLTGCKKAYSHVLYKKLVAELGTPEPKVLEPVP